MPKLILNNNYLLTVDNWSTPNNIKKTFNKHYKFIKKSENRLIFSDGEKTITLWTNHRGYYNPEQFVANITLEKNNNYRVTQYPLNSNSIFVCISFSPIPIDYLNSFSCITTLSKLLFLIDFYNKIRVKKNLKRIPAIKKVFQDYYITRYISEYL